MANIASTQVQNILNTVAFPQFQKAFSNTAGFLGQVGMSAGKARVQIPMHKTGMAVSVTSNEADYAGAFSEGSAIPVGQGQGRQTVEWNYARYGTTVSVDGMVQAKALAGGYNALSDLLADELLLAVDDLKYAITLDMLGEGATSTSSMAGVSDIVGNTNTSLAGVDQTGASWFASYVKAGGSASLTLAMMDDVWDNLVDSRLSPPSSIWTSQKQFSAYEGLLTANARYNPVPTAKGDARFMALDYRGVPVIAIPKYNNARMDFVIGSDFALYYLPQKSYTSEGKLVEGAFKVEAKDASGKDEIAFTVVCYMVLVCRNPFKQGVVNALA
ncbi:MAG: phage major capsid protein [Erythrobacter sp.]|jgi:hypothetical protein|nr:phage major capsid protein [Erythrobacter sp.]